MIRDKADVWAEALVSSMLETGGLELVTKHTRSSLISVIAAQLARGDTRPSSLADLIMRTNGVSELHLEDDALAELMRRTQPSRDEVLVSDAAARAISDAMTKPVVRAPAPGPFERLAADAKDVMAAAAESARRAGHLETTLDHVLVEMLAKPKIAELAKRRGGHPEEARERASTQLASARRATVVQPTPPLAQGVLDMIEVAQELAPRLVAIGDLALAAMQGNHERFVLAFGRTSAPETPSRSEEEEIGPFTISKDFTSALVNLFDREHERLRAQRALGSACMIARILKDTERELETRLPEDFWAAAAAGIDELAWLGIAESQGAPIHPEEIGELVLSAMVAAESAEIELEADGEPLVAFMSLDDDEAFLCIQRGVTDAPNAQPIYEISPERTTRYDSFGAWVLAVSRAR